MLLGFVDNDPSFADTELAGAGWLGLIDDLHRIVAREAEIELLTSNDLLTQVVSLPTPPAC